ncbi:MAG: methicillin resistance protein, partial [Spirochaetes bacterium]|nr:methicillin resistance protein [Spirochaetota bacterium]
MLEIDYIDPLTDPRWDVFVEKHESGWIGHLSIWKRILDENFKYLKGLYIILKDKNEIIAGLPIYYVNSWLRGKRLIHIPFCTICDPLVSSKEELDLLLKEVFSIFDKYKPKGLEIRTLNSDKYFSDAVFQKNDYYKYHYLLLDKSLDDIWKNFHRTCIKQRINRATESGMMLKISEGYDDLKKFLKLYLHTRQRLGLPPLPFKFIENLWEVFHEK